MAAELFQEQGFNATGINQIAARGGLPKGSIYFHFPGGKEEIAIGAIAASSDHVVALLSEAADGASSEQDFLKNILTEFADQLQHSDYQKGCPISAITLEMASRSENIRRACERAYCRWIEFAEQTLATFGLHPDKAEQQARLFLYALEGALLISRAQRTTDPLNSLEKMLLSPLGN